MVLTISDLSVHCIFFVEFTACMISLNLGLFLDILIFRGYDSILIGFTRSVCNPGTVNGVCFSSRPFSTSFSSFSSIFRAFLLLAPRVSASCFPLSNLSLSFCRIAAWRRFPASCSFRALSTLAFVSFAAFSCRTLSANAASCAPSAPAFVAANSTPKLT